jgi:hypothetical protein
MVRGRCFEGTSIPARRGLSQCIEAPERAHWQRKEYTRYHRNSGDEVGRAARPGVGIPRKQWLHHVFPPSHIHEKGALEGPEVQM